MESFAEPEAPMGEEPAEEGAGTSGLSPEFLSAATDALDAALSPEERAIALKEAIVTCLEEHESGGYEPPGEKKGKGGDALALIFGGGPKGKAKE